MLATCGKIAGSVTRTASPPRVRSMPGSLTEIVQAGVRRQVACLASTGPAGETQVAVVPYRADPGRAGACRAGLCQGTGRERGAELAGDDRIALVPGAVERSKMRCRRT